MARVAIVTGGTRGIGEAISIALNGMGMKVAATYAGNDERARAFSERSALPSMVCFSTTAFSPEGTAET